jgi:hypothetical protein
MDVPGIVESALDGESVAVGVQLDGEDAAFVTPTRTLVYRGEGLLSDESVTAFPHGAERVAVSEGRRSASITLDYGLDGERELSVPVGRVDEVLHPLLAGVFNARGVTDSGETTVRTYRFSELTLVVTSDRLIKHVGESVFDEEYEEVPYESVTGIAVEEGNVASQLVLETGGRMERIKTPNEQARDVRETVEEALFDYHDVSSRDEFERTVGAAEDADATATATTEPADEGDLTFAESDLDPIEGTGPSGEATDASENGFTGSPFETASADIEGDGEEADPAAQLDALREALDRQQALIERQQATVERLARSVSRDQ